MPFSSATTGTVTIFTVFRVPPLSGLAPETTVWMEERCCACTGCFSVYGRLRLFKITAFMHSEGSLLVTVTIISCSVFTNRSLQYYPCFVFCHSLLLYAILHIYSSRNTCTSRSSHTLQHIKPLHTSTYLRGCLYFGFNQQRKCAIREHFIFNKNWSLSRLNSGKNSSGLLSNALPCGVLLNVVLCCYLTHFQSW